MKIAIYQNLPSGGAKRALYEWTNRLAVEHEIDVYSLSTADHDYCDLRPIVQSYKIYDFESSRLFESPFGRLNQLQRWRDLNRLDRLHSKIAQEINRSNYDVLFANTCTFTFIPALIQYIRIPSVYYMHEPYGPGFDRHIERPYIRQDGLRKSLDRYDPLIKLYNKRLAKIQHQSTSSTDKLLANSKFTQERVNTIFSTISSVVPYGVNLDSFHRIPNIQKGDFVVSVGEMSARKGFDFIIESLGYIPTNDRPSLKLACNMVNSSELEYIQDLASQLEVDLQVLTHLGTDDLCRLYNQARVCVYAPVMEPFGLVPLEAMACGTPVIGVREGGVQESVIHEYNGLLINRCAEEFGTAVQRLFADPMLIELYGRNGREYVVQNWTWDKSVTLIQAVLENCSKNPD